MKEKAVLFGPFVGELYWEIGRFAPMLPHMVLNKYKNENLKYIVLTRRDRFDIYGRFADILVPLDIPGDYTVRKPECFRLIGLDNNDYQNIAKSFHDQYSNRFEIVQHVYPTITKPAYLNKNQFHKHLLTYMYKPRQENYDLVDKYIPNDKPIVLLAPRFRKGFKRNWPKWQEFYDRLFYHGSLRHEYNFVICGKEGEYIPDSKDRYYDINKIPVGDKSSLVGLLLALMERAFFTCGSQSSIPNISLLYKVDVLEFGCQKVLHTKTYNIHNSAITFIENRNYDLDPKVLLKNLRKLLAEKRGNISG